MNEKLSESFVVSYVVKTIIHRNQDTGFTIFSLKNLKSESENEIPDSALVGKGTFEKIKEGDSFRSVASWDSTKDYGIQLKFSTSFPIAPSNIRGIKRFLCHFISGVGKKTSDDIVELYGLETLSLLKQDYHYAMAVPGIGERKAKKIYEEINAHSGLEDLSVYLFSYGITNYMAIVTIYEELGVDSLNIIKANPYALCNYLSPSYFSIADQISLKNKFEYNHINRIKNAAYCCIKTELYKKNDIYISFDRFKSCFLSWIHQNEAYAYQQIDGQVFIQALKLLSDEKKIVLTKNKDGLPVIYLSSLYHSESNCVTALSKMLLDKSDPISSEIKVTGFIDQFEKESSISLDPLQKEAVYNACKYKISIITGGPGTGKTGTINVLIHYFEKFDLVVGMAAPTGRAAKRMSEMCNRDAYTIHRLLALRHGESLGDIEELELDMDVLIVDEFSMVDIVLASHLFTVAQRKGIRLVIVGDYNQLPSVGPGLVLRDLIESNVIPCVQLVTLFRQAKESQIALNAHKIIDGIPCGVEGGLTFDKKKKDFFFFKADNEIEYGEVLLRNIQFLIDSNINPNDITVLSPVRKGFAGVEYLNGLIRDLLNPPDETKTEIHYRNKIYRVGDRIMQERNNYEKERGKYEGVFNGEIGIIKEINLAKETIIVSFQDTDISGGLVSYKVNELNEISHAYCITVHKSQGSEFPITFIPALPFPNFNRNLLYTAVTRAKKMTVLIGYDQALNHAISTVDTNSRLSELKPRLKQILNTGD